MPVLCCFTYGQSFVKALNRFLDCFIRLWGRLYQPACKATFSSATFWGFALNLLDSLSTSLAHLNNSRPRLFDGKSLSLKSRQYSLNQCWHHLSFGKQNYFLTNHDYLLRIWQLIINVIGRLGPFFNQVQPEANSDWHQDTELGSIWNTCIWNTYLKYF